MNKRGIDISGNRVKHVDEFRRAAQFVTVSICESSSAATTPVSSFSAYLSVAN